jgi:hypothetical protein
MSLGQPRREVSSVPFRCRQPLSAVAASAAFARTEGDAQARARWRYLCQVDYALGGVCAAIDRRQDRQLRMTHL